MMPVRALISAVAGVAALLSAAGAVAATADKTAPAAGRQGAAALFASYTVSDASSTRWPRRSRRS